MQPAFTARACFAAAFSLLCFTACTTSSQIASTETVTDTSTSPLPPGHGKNLSTPKTEADAIVLNPDKNHAGSISLSGGTVTATVRTTLAPVTVAQRLLDEPTRRVLKLSNGFTIILQQNKTAPVVAARIYVKAGSLTEQQYMGAGISHVVEHLVAGASSGKRKEAENTLLLQEIGNDSNAETTMDTTCYFITTSAQKWPVALDLLTDWTTDANFTKEEFAREYKVVQREIEMDEAQADNTFYLNSAANRYLENPARHPTIGYKPAFQKLTFEDVQKYYHLMYVPDNMIVSVAGDIDLTAAEKLVIEKLSGVERKVVRDIPLSPEPNTIAPRQAVARADVRQARAMWTFPTTDLFSPDLYATDVLANILGAGESSLLVQQLRDDKSLVIDIAAYNDTPRYAPGGLSVTATLAPDKILATQSAVLELLAKVQKDGVTEDQLKRAKAQVSAQRVYGNQTAEQQSIRNALDFIATGNIDFTEIYTKHVEAVTADAVQTAAKKFIIPDHMITTVLLPLNAPNPFDNGAAKTATAAAESATKKVVLKNGLTVLITKNPAAPIVTFNLFVKGGLLDETAATSGIGNAMMQLLPRGTESRSHEQIAQLLDETATSLTSESGNNSFSLSAQCLKQNASAAFDLFADVALHPKFSAEEFERLRPQLLSAIEQSTEDWFDEAYKNTKEQYYKDSPYKRLAVGNTDVVTKLTAESLRAHYQNDFLVPDKTVLAIAGDIDEESALAWAKKFETIPSHENSAVAAAPTSTLEAAHRIDIKTAKQSSSVFFAFPPGSTVTSPDRYALTLLQTYLGGYSSPGGSVLHETLRGQGLVYTVQASNIPGPAGGMFLIAALGEPANTEKIITMVNQIIADTKAGKFSDKALELAKDQTITGERLSKQTIAEKSSSQARDELFGLGYDADTHLAENINKLTKADLVRVANQYLQTPTIVVTSPK